MILNKIKQLVTVFSYGQHFMYLSFCLTGFILSVLDLICERNRLKNQRQLVQSMWRMVLYPSTWLSLRLRARTLFKTLATKCDYVKGLLVYIVSDICKDWRVTLVQMHGHNHYQYIWKLSIKWQEKTVVQRNIWFGKKCDDMNVFQYSIHIRITRL